MDIQVKLVGVTKENKRIKRKDATGQKVDDVETIHTLKLAMQKIKYDRDENVKEGTDDPWARVSISSYDEKMFKEFEKLKMGASIVMTIEPE